MGIGGYFMMDNTMTFGDFISFTLFLGFMIAPIVQMSNIGSQLTEAMAGLDRTQELMEMTIEDNPKVRTKMQQSPFTESELAGIKGFDGMMENIQSLAITIDTAISSTDPSQRAEDSAEVSCFLNSTFTAEIERGEFEKVSGFLQLLRKKFERHQQVSCCSKRIFKPPSR